MLDKPTEARIAETELGAPIDPGTRIGHVHLKVADIDRALAFYCGVLGFQLMQRYGTQDELVAMVEFIVSPACSFTTGFTFDLSGGRATY